MTDIPPGQCRCSREWWALGEAHCSSCHSHFTSDSAFDRHLASAQSRDDCYDPLTLRDRHGRRVFESIQRKSGATWRVKRDKPHYLAGKTPVDAQGGSDGVPGSLATPKLVLGSRQGSNV